MLRLFLLTPHVSPHSLCLPALAGTVGDDSGKAVPPDQLAKILAIMSGQERLSPDVVLTNLRRAESETPICCGMAKTADLTAPVPFAVDVVGETALVLTPDLLGEARDDVKAAIAAFGCPT